MTQPRTRTWLAVGLSLLIASPLHGQPAHGPPAHGDRPRDKHGAAVAIVGDLVMLSGTDLAAAATAATQLGTFAEAHADLVVALTDGPPAQVAVAVLDAVAAHPAPGDVAALARYAGHRNPVVRGAALGALAHYADPAAQAAVAAGLHDPIAAVRTAAAAAAARGHVRVAIDPLMQLLARGEEPAARALSALADRDLAAKIAAQYGTIPDPLLALCLGGVLRRADFGPDAARVEVVHALAQIQDPAALSALTEYLDATPKQPPRDSRREAEKLVNARLGGGQ